MWLFSKWQQRRILQHARLDEVLWQQSIAEIPALTGLSEHELSRLKELVILFLHTKSIQVKGDLDDHEHLRLLIATQACLPILNLGLAYYRDWSTIIVYPQAFTRHEMRDSAGVVHVEQQVLVGEAWDLGPVVLSWHDVLSSGNGFNVVIHEFAHKLDMLNGELNGFPPLHAGMDPQWWSKVFMLAFKDFSRQLETNRNVPFDPYAASSPAEFFAVMSEVFFETPELLRAVYAPVYRQLSEFYRQDPAVRQL